MVNSPRFLPGKSYIPVSGKVFDNEEINNAIKAARDGWWTEGEFGKKFESEFRKFLGVEYVSLVNSGSSANLLALYSLTSSVFGKRQLKPGDEFITTAVAFPTTVNPGVLYGLKPIFIDAEIDTLNIDASQIEKSITKKTKLIMIAHTLGRPFDLDKITRLCKKYNLWLIEDCCDALGTKYKGKYVSSFGDIATFSFYPAHQMTMGEGGAVVTNNPLINRSIRQFRDWGRDCWCDTGHDNTCGKRFGWKLGELPQGYDHKYIYSQIGFNLKLTDFQAAIGVAQIKKLPKFIKTRQKNYRELYNFIKRYEKDLILMKHSPKDDFSYFGLPIVVKPHASFTRNDLTEYLESNHIGTRNIFSGNLLRHPAYVSRKDEFKIVGSMKIADLVMNNAFWIGVWPGINRERINYMCKTIKEFMKSRQGK